MKFLDLNGLIRFWSKIKASFVKTKGASEIEMDDDNEGLRVNNVSSSSTTLVPSGFISYNINSDEQSEMVAKLQFGDLLLKKIHIINGTSSQILIADGSTKTINAANGICGLDSNGNVPLRQLGNLDTTVAEVVTALPTTNIKKHIYLIKDASGVTQNKYEEYIYTGDTSATYDASKWEKLGDFRATVDLANYYTKSQVDSIANGKSSTSHTHSVIINGVTKTIAASGGAAVNLGTYLTSHQSLAEYAKKSEAATSLEITPSANDIQFVLRAISGSEIDWPSLDPATSTKAGIMTAKDKVKLDGIANNANNYSLPTASSTIKGGITLGYSQNGKNYPVVLDSTGKAYVNVPWTDTNTTYDLSPYAKKADVNAALAKKVDVVSGKGLSTEDFTAALKTKLNGIANGATADSAITTAEIDALFA